MKKLLTAGSVLALVILACQPALRAAIIPNVSVIGVSSEYPSLGGDSRAATNLVGTCGLFGSSHTWNPNGATWLTSDASPSTSFVTFDLGAIYNLRAIKIYNYNDETTTSTAGTSNGVQNADFLFGTVQDTYTTTYPNVTLAKAPSVLNNFSDFSTNLMLTNLMARYVQIKVNSNWGSSSNHVGLSKVRFIDTNVLASATFATVNWLSNAVTINFSEGVSVASATNAGNYVVSNSVGGVISISSVAMGPFNDSVVLQTPGLINGPYTVSVAKVAVLSDGTFISNTLPVVSQLAFWLKGDVGVVTNATGVTTWMDQSGNGNDAIQTNSTLQPIVTPNDINGLPSVKFGTTGYLDVPFSPTMGGSRDTAIFALLRVASNGVNNEIISRAAINRAAPFDYRYQANKLPIFYRGNDFGSGSYGSQTGTLNIPSNNVYALVGVNVRGTNTIQYINGPQNGSAGVELLGVRDSQSVTRIGGRADNGAHLDGNMAEIMMFRGGVTDADRLAINGYISAKYGLIISDLVFTVQPTNITVLQGQTASFSAAASGSTPTTITYQWQTNGVNIAGATKASYTTPLLTLGDSGEMFSLIASQGANKATSTVAVLTVNVDTIAPTLIYAGRQIWNSNIVVAVFSKSISPVSGVNLGNYSLDSGTITAAAIGSSLNKVFLTTTGNPTQLTVQNVQDLFNNTIAFSQVPIGTYPQLAMWLRADAGVTTDGSGNVTEWDDQSVNGNNTFGVSSPPAAEPPTFLPSVFNGKPAIHFDGVANFLAANSSPSLAITGDIGIYTVIQYTDFGNTTGTEVIGKTGGTAQNIPAPFDYYAGAGDGQMKFYRGNGGTGGSGVSYQSVFSSSNPTAGVPHVLGVTQTGSAVVHFLDGLNNGTGSITVVPTDNGATLGIGTRNDLLPKMKGEIAELMLFSAGLDTVDRSNLDAMLGTKYGITIQMPAVPSPKLSVALASGTSLNISWPTPTVGFILQSSGDLTTTNWVTVANTTNTVAGTNTVTVTTTGAQQFFRLKQQ